MGDRKPEHRFPDLYPVEGLPGEPYQDFVFRKKKEYLVNANRQRVRLKVLRNALRLGAIDDLQLLKGNLRDYEPVIAKWRIEQLLRACRGIGAARSNTILEMVKVSPRRRVNQLTYRQREELAYLVDEVRSKWV